MRGLSRSSSPSIVILQTGRAGRARRWKSRRTNGPAALLRLPNSRRHLSFNVEKRGARKPRARTMRPQKSGRRRKGGRRNNPQTPVPFLLRRPTGRPPFVTPPCISCGISSTPLKIFTIVSIHAHSRYIQSEFLLVCLRFPTPKHPEIHRFEDEIYLD